MNRPCIALLAIAFAGPSFAAGLECRSTAGHFNGQTVSVRRTVKQTDRPGWFVFNGVYNGSMLPEVELLCRGHADSMYCHGSHYGGQFFVAIGPGWMTEFVSWKTGREIARLTYSCSGTLLG